MAFQARGPSTAVENLIIGEDGAGRTAAPAAGDATNGLSFKGQCGCEIGVVACLGWGLFLGVTDQRQSCEQREQVP